MGETLAIVALLFLLFTSVGMPCSGLSVLSELVSVETSRSEKELWDHDEHCNMQVPVDLWHT